MAVTTYDTHLFVKTLTQKGFTEPQAEAIIEVAGHMRETDLRSVATKADLREMEISTKAALHELGIATKAELRELELRLQAQIKADLADAKTDIIKWVIGMGFALAALMLTVLKLHI